MATAKGNTPQTITKPPIIQSGASMVFFPGTPSCVLFRTPPEECCAGEAVLRNNGGFTDDKWSAGFLRNEADFVALARLLAEMHGLEIEYLCADSQAGRSYATVHFS